MATGRVGQRWLLSSVRTPIIGLEIAAWRVAVLALALLLPVLGALAPVPPGLPPQAMLALGLIAMTVVLWATMAIPQPAAAILFLVLVSATGIASAP